MLTACVTVILASYNGASHIKEQLESIYSDLKPGDEVIISDDGSIDETVNIANRVALKFPYVSTQIIKGPHEGISANFSNALFRSNGSYVFFSDQDDIWIPGKRDTVVAAFENSDALVVLHNMNLIDDNGIEILDNWFQRTPPVHGVTLNLLRSSYWGCCMAISSTMKEYLNPGLKNCIAHDQFIGLIGERFRGSIFIDEILLSHRITGSNQSKSLSLINKAKFRITLIEQYLRQTSIYGRV